MLPRNVEKSSRKPSQDKRTARARASTDRWSSLVDAARENLPVSGYSHDFYRYPARFSPVFARTAIELFSAPGELVFDPFVGGGTSAVEALASGRQFVGCDLNPLAVFVSRAKCTPLTRNDIDRLLDWSEALWGEADARATQLVDEEPSHFRNMPWWLKNCVAHALLRVDQLTNERQRNFAKLTLLRATQWALETGRSPPTAKLFREYHSRVTEMMLRQSREYSLHLRRAGVNLTTLPKQLDLFERSVVGVNEEVIWQSKAKPKLVITSPPYLGVHVLYHRWQVRGRRETAAPYWIVGKPNGYGAGHFTFGDRRHRDPSRYLEQVGAAFTSIAEVLAPKGLVIQLIGFSTPRRHLRLYLEALREAGLREVDLLASHDGRRAWRAVPRRRWYTELGSGSASAKELLLVHTRA